MTDYAIVLYFDKRSEETIRIIQNTVGDSCGNSYMIVNNIPPHITVSSFSREEHYDILDVIESFAEQIVDVYLPITSIGIFNSILSVVNLLPVVTDQLKQINHELHKRLAEKVEAFDAYYVEPNWVPHCAIAVKLSEFELMNAISKLCTIFSPLTVKVNRIALVKCNPFRDDLLVWNIK
jgi:2'-5' RNA ligase